MNWQTNPQMICLRSFARKFGINRIIGRLISKDGYEAAFDEALLNEIRSNDVVWDIGANVGYYTRKFAETCGNNGHVIAFEPFPRNVAKLRANISDLRNVSIVQQALGREVTTLNMLDGSDELGATSRILEGDAATGVMVEVVTGDHAVEQAGLPIPNVIKIDTEGFEFDVLVGMENLTEHKSLRA